MTQREREILKASVSWTDKTLTIKEEKAFQAGAKWADKTMIDKACEWIKENFECYVGVDVSPYYIYANEFVEDFRKAMEE